MILLDLVFDVLNAHLSFASSSVKQERLAEVLPKFEVILRVEMVIEL